MNAPMPTTHDDLRDLQDLPSYPKERDDYINPARALLTGPPVSPLRFAGGSTGWLVTGYHEAREVLRDPRFSAERWRGDDTMRPVPESIRRDRSSGAGSFLAMDAPQHGHYRGQLTRYFTVRRMRELEARIEDIVADQLDALEAAGKPADLVRHFALPIPSLVICEMLGVPYEERELFQSVAARLLRQDRTDAEFVAGKTELDTFLGALVEAKRKDPRDDLISLLTAVDEFGDEEIGGIAGLLLIAGHETTTNMLSLGTFALLRDPEQLERLRADESLLPQAVEELLRYLSIVNAFPVRIALEDVVVGDVTVTAGQSVAVSVPAANRDPALVDDPDTLDVGRPRSSHLAFGYGIHQCLGQHLARIELVAGYRGLLRRFPGLRLAVPPEEVRMRSDMVIYGAHELPVTW
ncbi:cytochrome P450 [Streptomyces rugosispiralis]|uniref:Cytochrome P450 n=1 Tax=Streptomyces rugosispiralis TaxID=2967341 RepID=A0ABT1UR04_9ACTN|nr:cytochrome P450 [Streptomyces rugosispiralis]MCQ8187431.1 cytochrome P450 [Streptomyces rugosispiralis]